MWLNTPRRPQEASGTSGMKAAMNGVLNCSILDGWWAEGYAPEVGFAIGGLRRRPDEDEQDANDRQLSTACSRRRLSRVLPPRPERATASLARDDAARVDRRLGQQFNTNRMVREYVDTMYLPARTAHSPARS